MTRYTNMPWLISLRKYPFVKCQLSNFLNTGYMKITKRWMPLYLTYLTVFEICVDCHKRKLLLTATTRKIKSGR